MGGTLRGRHRRDAEEERRGHLNGQVSFLFSSRVVSWALVWYWSTEASVQGYERTLADCEVYRLGTSLCAKVPPLFGGPPKPDLSAVLCCWLPRVRRSPNVQSRGADGLHRCNPASCSTCRARCLGHLDE